MLYFGAFTFRESFGIADRWNVADPMLLARQNRTASTARGEKRRQRLLTYSVLDSAKAVSADSMTVVFEEAYDWEPHPRPVLHSGEITVSENREHFGGSGSSEEKTENVREEKIYPTTSDSTFNSSNTSATGNSSSSQQEKPKHGSSGSEDDEAFASVAVSGLANGFEGFGDKGLKLAPDILSFVTELGAKTIGNLSVGAGQFRYHTPDSYRARLKPKQKKNYKGKHVFCLVHGYQGNSWDMRLFKNQLMLRFPDLVCMLSTANENHTEGDINDMGRRLGKELDTFVKENCRGGSTLGRLSFVCHSLGGIIVRSALAQATQASAESSHGTLKPYLDKCYTFLSLASPHCGYMYAENQLLTTGIFLLRKWNKSACLTQLSLADHEDQTQTFIYKLSQQKGLEYFENVMLVASELDKYAPFHSARIEMHKSAMGDTKRGVVYRNMVHHMLSPLKTTTVKRFNVSFVNKKKNIDALIGRTAHIYFLDQTQYMELLTHVYQYYFM